MILVYRSFGFASLVHFYFDSIFYRIIVVVLPWSRFPILFILVILGRVATFADDFVCPSKPPLDQLSR